MKIGSRSDFVQKASVVLIPERDGQEAVMVQINSVPFGFDQQIEEELPSPKPPLKVMRDPVTGKSIPVKGKPGVFVTVPDKEDEEFQREERIITRLQAAMTFYHGTKCDGGITWEVDPAQLSGRKFYEGVAAELKQSGIPFGAVSKVAVQVMRISGVDSARIKEVEKVFLEQEESGE